jgi:hypothetical protein
MCEFQKYNAFCWITQGKEIENYVSYKAIELAYKEKLNSQCKQFEMFPDYVKSVYPRFANDKVSFAHKVCEYISEENSREILDLKKKIQSLGGNLRLWNSR